MAVEDNMKNIRMFELSTQKEFLHEAFIQEAMTKVPAIEKCAYVLHDKDVYEVGHEKAGQPKPPHWHVFVKLRYPQKICHIASWYNVKQNYIERIKGKFSDALKYLIHENAPEKYQYPVEEVKCSEGFDWIKEKNKGDSNRALEIMNLITTGEIREHNIHKMLKNFEFHKYRSQIKSSFEFRRKIIIDMGGKKMDVIFITGDSGVGKTTYAKEIANKMNLSFFVAGGTNDPFDGYGGQDCVILDDLRPQDQHISDLLKLTDNHTASLVKARFFNKVVNEVKLMIITSILEIEKFYKDAMDSEPDKAVQLCRRVYACMRMTPEFVIILAYNEVTNRYDEVCKMPNVVKEVYKANKEGQKKKIDALKSIVMGAGECMLHMAKNAEDYMEKKE